MQKVFIGLILAFSLSSFGQAYSVQRTINILTSPGIASELEILEKKGMQFLGIFDNNLGCQGDCSEFRAVFNAYTKIDGLGKELIKCYVFIAQNGDELYFKYPSMKCQVYPEDPWRMEVTNISKDEEIDLSKVEALKGLDLTFIKKTKFVR